MNLVVLASRKHCVKSLIMHVLNGAENPANPQILRVDQVL